jgi:D-alanyl-lipoteichoic acid acyltransferase DltB (MBOAT superfamily)
MLLVASYVFYGAWNWRFLFLVLVSTMLDYACGLRIHATEDQRRKKLFLVVSVTGNLTILGFFKYYNFFSSSLLALLSHFGLSFKPHLFDVILPLGISFYTFQTMSYTIDIYRGKMEPTKKFFDFALFVAFFPQLVAGPIERAKRLLPQILAPRKLTVESFYEGCYLIFWGLFQKVFVADNLAKLVDPVFGAPPPYDGAKVLIALYAFSFQIFCDFAGYSNIARGLGKCLGFEIMINFNLPYCATNPREFWRRWHISLSTWLRDYLYVSLGGNRKGRFRTYRNLTITMLLGGLWHGAAWTFVAWGMYHGVLLAVHRACTPLLEKLPAPKTTFVKNLWFFIRVAAFFHLVCVGWLFFRALSLIQAYQMLQALLGAFGGVLSVGFQVYALKLVFFTWLLIAVQAAQFLRRDLMAVMKAPVIIRTVFYTVCYYLLIVYGVTVGEEFIYFQF